MPPIISLLRKVCQERDLPTRELTRGLYYAKTHISFPTQVPTVVVLVFGFWFKFFVAFSAIIIMQLL